MSTACLCTLAWEALYQSPEYLGPLPWMNSIAICVYPRVGQLDENLSSDKSRSGQSGYLRSLATLGLSQRVGVVAH
jgi:hypothetical protein